MVQKNTPQHNANQLQNKKRHGTPTYSSVRFKDKDRLDEIEKTIKLFGGTKEESLIAAYKLLNESLQNK
ncbi:hypothetical protein [Psychromonas sp. SP041]|uniref:hypothetical protein n=1 Tax=Psychromonas sp. SP041 TaxID=1365007 RepID=UPI0010C79867|nr:hypothetical protein [Psychromonas sp. SP041]